MFRLVQWICTKCFYTTLSIPWICVQLKTLSHLSFLGENHGHVSIGNIVGNRLEKTLEFPTKVERDY